MKNPARVLSAASVAAVLSVGLVFLGPSSQPAQGRGDTTITEADLLAWTTEFSNHGRWRNAGLGAANLITPHKRRDAAKLVKEGISVSMAHNVPQTLAEDPTYLKRTVLAPAVSAFISDQYEYQGTYHGSTHSHLDALSCHVHFAGRGWNNFFYQVTQESGCSEAQGGIIAVKNGVFTRGVLVDLPRFKGVAKDYLEAGDAAIYEDLVAYEKWAKVKVAPGDAIFLRTGRWKRQAMLGPYVGGNPGWHASVLAFFHARDVSYIGSDHINDVLPTGFPNSAFILPIHQIVMPTMGINIFDNLDLEELAQTAAQLGRYTFLLTAAPLRIDKGLGSPANPIATF
jgi:kynurenine formamidase